MPHHLLSQHTTPRTARGASFHHLLHSQCRKSRARARGGGRHLWRVGIAAILFMVRLRRIVRTAPRLTQRELDFLRKVYWEVAVADAFDESSETVPTTAANENLYSVEGITNFLQRFKEPQPPTTVNDLLRYVGYRAQRETGVKQTNMLLSQLVMMFTFLKREQVTRSKVTDEEALFDAFVGDDGDVEAESSISQLPTEAKIRSSPIEQALQSFDLKVLPPQMFHTTDLAQQQHDRTTTHRNPRLTMREFIHFLRQGTPTATLSETAINEERTNSSQLTSPIRGTSPVDSTAMLRGNPSIHFVSCESPSGPQRETTTASERHLSAAFSTVGALMRYRRQHSEVGGHHVVGGGVTPLSATRNSGVATVSEKQLGGSLSFSGIDLLIEVEDDGPSDEVLALQQRLIQLKGRSGRAAMQKKYDVLHRSTNAATLRKEWDKFDPLHAQRSAKTLSPSAGQGMLTLVRRTAPTATHGENDQPNQSKARRPNSAVTRRTNTTTHASTNHARSGINQRPASALHTSHPQPSTSTIQNELSQRPGSAMLPRRSTGDALGQGPQYTPPLSVAQEVEQRIHQEEERNRAKFLRRMVGAPSFELTRPQRQSVVAAYNARCLELNKRYELCEQHGNDDDRVATAAREVAAEVLSALNPQHHSNHAAAVNKLCATSEHSLLHIPIVRATARHVAGSYEVALRSRPQSAASHRSLSIVAQTALPPPQPYQLH